MVFENGKNYSSTSRKFNVDRKRIRKWLKQEESLVNEKRGSSSNGRGCTSRFPLMEQALYDDYKKARDEGKTIKRSRFNYTAKQLVKGLYPDENIKASDLPTVSKFYFVEKCIVHEKIQKV